MVKIQKLTSKSLLNRKIKLMKMLFKKKFLFVEVCLSVKFRKFTIILVPFLVCGFQM